MFCSAANEQVSVPWFLSTASSGYRESANPGPRGCPAAAPTEGETWSCTATGPPLLSGDAWPRRSTDKAMQDNVARCGKMHHAECVSIPGDLLPAPSPQGIIF